LHIFYGDAEEAFPQDGRRELGACRSPAGNAARTSVGHGDPMEGERLDTLERLVVSPVAGTFWRVCDIAWLRCA